jgi:hypothetical protein
MTDFSGHDEDQIVDAAGERACTVCYPSAPVAVLAKPTRMFTRDEVAAQAARAERATKAAAKNAAKVVDRDGKVIANTERGATNEIASLLDSYFWYVDHPSNAEWIARINQLIDAVAERRGVDAQELRSEMFAKAEAKDAKKKAGIVKKMKADPATNWDQAYDWARQLAGLLPIGN